MCLPLDEARDLYDAERDVFGWERGESELILVLVSVRSNYCPVLVPLIVIFTKRDGAVTKAMS